MTKTIVWDHSQEKTTRVTSINMLEVMQSIKTQVTNQVNVSEGAESVKYDFTEEQRAALLLVTAPGNSTIRILVEAFTGNKFEHPSETAEFLTYSNYLSDEEVFVLFMEDQMKQNDPKDPLQRLLAQVW